MPRIHYSGPALSRRGLLLVLFTALAGCTREEEVLPSKAALLAQHPWQLTGWTSSPAYPAVVGGVLRQYTDILALCRDVNNTCQPNQHLNFALGPAERDYENGAYGYRQGEAGCGTLFVNQSGQWYTDTSTGKLLLYLKDVSSTPGRQVLNRIYTVNELTGDRLAVSYRVSIAGSSTVYTYTLAFTAE